MNIASDITVLINAIRDLSKVGICYYDLNNFFHYNKWGIKNNRGHYCAFCENTRALPGGRESCEKSDRIEAVRLAMQYKEPFFFECHMGMRELVIPLMHSDMLIGILFIGHIFCCLVYINNALVNFAIIICMGFGYAITTLSSTIWSMF